MRYGIFAFTILFLSCGTPPENPVPDSSVDIVAEGITVSELWICHHPDTEFHEKKCIEESFPNGCYVPGDSSKFCWLLQREDCDESNPGAWLLNHCKLLNTRE